MDAGSSEGPRWMATTWTADHPKNLTAASRLFSDLLTRPLDLVRIWSEELDRALVATQRYGELSTGRGADETFRGRASKPRRVFDEMYASK